MFSQACVKNSVYWGACMAGGHAWWGLCGGGHVWQESQLLQWTVRILLECILVVFESRIFITETELMLQHLSLWLHPVYGLSIKQVQTVSFTTCSVTNEGKTHKYNTKKWGPYYLANYSEKLHKNVKKNVCMHVPPKSTS